MICWWLTEGGQASWCKAVGHGQPLDEWFGTTAHNGDVVNALCDHWKRMLYGALKEIDNGGVAWSPMLLGKQARGVDGGGDFAQQCLRARAPMVVEQTPQSGSTRQMLDPNNAESPLGHQSESFEEFWESLNKFKEEESTSGEASVQGSRVGAPHASPPPIPQASGKQPQRAKRFLKAGGGGARTSRRSTHTSRRRRIGKGVWFNRLL